MPQTEHLSNSIFQISNSTDFNEYALKIFHFQFKHNPLYRAFVENCSIDTSQIKHYQQIPFLPIDFFKSHQVITGKFSPEITFSSSGTTGMLTSKHLVKDVKLYKNSFLKSFNMFFGSPEEYVILALLPSYLEREESSLIYMVSSLIEQTRKSQSGFFLHNYDELFVLLSKLKDQDKKLILFGVSYALLDLAEQFPIEFPALKIIETGGMKGRRKEMVRNELHAILKQAFKVQSIYSEYGMTELLSQAYSKGDGVYDSPPWMKVLIRDTNDPFTLLPDGKTGGINVIDLANIHSCSFIATQDLGKKIHDDRFEVLGRFDNSDVRGCNLMVD